MKPRALIVKRELWRLARRRQLVAMRVVPALGIALIVVVVLARTGQLARADHFAEVGQALYRLSAAGLLLTVGFVGPANLARAVQLERDEGTLDLLALTGISPAQGLWGTVGAAMLSLLLMVLGTLPLIAMIPTLGGVAPGEVVSLLLVLPAMALLLCAVAGSTALVSRSMAMPLVLTAVFALAFGLLLPLRLAYAIYRAVGSSTGDLEWVSLIPITTAFDPDFWIPWGVVPWLVVAGVAAVVATWRFRRGVATGWDPLAKAWPGPRLGWVIHLPVVTVGMAVFEWFIANYDDARSSAPAFLVPGLGHDGHVVLLVGLAIATWTSAALLYLRAVLWLTPRLSQPRQRRRVPVFGNPVAWRELFTTAHGGLARAIWILALGWLVVAVVILLVSREEEVLAAWGAMAAFLTLLLTTLLLTTSIVDERRRRTLPLLCAAGFAPTRIVLGKVAAVAVRIGPLALLGALAVLAGAPEPILDLHGVEVEVWRSPTSPWGAHLLMGTPLVRLPVIAAWIAGFWLAVAFGTVAIAVRVRALSAAWSAPLILSVGAPILAIGCAMASSGLGRDHPWAEMLSTTIFPFQRAFFATALSGIPPELVLSTCLWWAIALTAFAVSSTWVGRWGPRSGR